MEWPPGITEEKAMLVATTLRWKKWSLTVSIFF